jgi:hypothetical protein
MTRRGQVAAPERHDDGGSRQAAAPAPWAGEDRNNGTAAIPDVFNLQHRPHGAGDDRNTFALLVRDGIPSETSL